MRATRFPRKHVERLALKLMAIVAFDEHGVLDGEDEYLFETTARVIEDGLADLRHIREHGCSRREAAVRAAMNADVMGKMI